VGSKAFDAMLLQCSGCWSTGLLFYVTASCQSQYTSRLQLASRSCRTNALKQQLWSLGGCQDSAYSKFKMLLHKIVLFVCQRRSHCVRQTRCNYNRLRPMYLQRRVTTDHPRWQMASFVSIRDDTAIELSTSAARDSNCPATLT
jgi:hypothetical protein